MVPRPPENSENFEMSDFISGESPWPNMSINEFEVVPIGSPDASSSASVLMSL